jgi:hypothetical protein
MPLVAGTGLASSYLEWQHGHHEATGPLGRRRNDQAVRFVALWPLVVHNAHLRRLPMRPAWTSTARGAATCACVSPTDASRVFETSRDVWVGITRGRRLAECLTGGVGVEELLEPRHFAGFECDHVDEVGLIFFAGRNGPAPHEANDGDRVFINEHFPWL